MPVQHLLKQVELYRERKAERENRDVRPAWLTTFINEAAELFEPASGVGRVGFDCRLSEDSWQVDLFLGTTEMVGGATDGETKQIDFTFDAAKAIALFDDVHRFLWSIETTEQNKIGNEERNSLLSIEGFREEQSVLLKIHAAPPSQTGPALRQYQDGTIDTV